MTPLARIIGLTFIAAVSGAGVSITLHHWVAVMVLAVMAIGCGWKLAKELEIMAETEGP